MNFISSFIEGIKYFFKGISLCKQKELRKFMYLPLLLNIVITSIGLYFAFSEAFSFSEELIANYLPSWLSFIKWLVTLILWVLIFILVIYTFTTITLLIGSPFYSILSEKTEKFISNKQIVELSTKDLIKDIPHIIGLEILKFLYRIPILLISFICLFIPVFGPIIIAMLSSWGCAMDYTSYGFENNRISLKLTRKALSSQKPLCFGFGLCVWACMLIPIINFFIVPAAVCGGTALWNQKFRPIFEEEINKLITDGSRKVIK
jgi:CysZ protein